MTTAPKEARLSLWTKLAFGSGDWSASSFGTLRQIFYAIFITDVVGLEPRDHVLRVGRPRVDLVGLGADRDALAAAQHA